jgi:type II secretory pathway component PulC
LAVVVAYQLSNSFPLAPTVTAAPPGAPGLDLAEGPAPPRAPDDAAVEQIAARPLFSASRQPYLAPPAPVEEAAEPSRPSLPLELAGTYLTENDQAALLLVSGGSPTWLRKGQLIEGWQIEDIGQDRVELRKDGRQQVLQLREDIAVLKTNRPAGRQAGRDDATSRALASEPVEEDDATQE